MDLQNLISKLHPLERAIIPVLKEHTELAEIIRASGLTEVEVVRAVQWLENKKILTSIAERRKIVSLEKNGQYYQKNGLPEKKFLSVLDDSFKGLNVIAKKSRLTKEEINACLGLLKNKQAIEIKTGRQLQIKITEQGKNLLQTKMPEEKFLEQEFPKPLNKIKEPQLIEVLKRRKEFLTIGEQKNITIQLTKLGEGLLLENLGGEVVNRVTSGMLKTGEWKSKQFRAYDIEINVPVKYPGKKHWVTQATEYAKKIWVEMGFQEMGGNMINTSFWNFDALFTAQDHPVREMQDTFFIGGTAQKGKLPDPNLVNKVREMHETGGNIESSGWQYRWDDEEAKKNVLRTHTTVLTAKKLAQLKEKDLPVKLFAIGKNFRNEALDWNHLHEFNQTEGIVVDENVNFCHLLGYLKQFFTKMGFPQARFRPAFFPYTSPSVEIDVYHPVHQRWVEFGGAGMLRPEVVVPLLGKDVPVLAWGPGFDRIILDYWNITDIRQLYKNDLKQLRESKIFLK